MYKSIYIDTSVFCEHCFELPGGPLRRLAEVAELRDIELLSSDIAWTELRIVIGRRSQDIGLSKANLALQESERFYKMWSVRQLRVDEDLDESDITTVFSDYFNRRSCFAGKKKKSEFPDAFQIQMILRNVNRGGFLAVLSRDGDFKSALGKIDEVRLFDDISDLIGDLEKAEVQEDDIVENRSPEPERLSDLEFVVLAPIREHHESVDFIFEDVLNAFTEPPSKEDVIEVIRRLVEKQYVGAYLYDRDAHTFVTKQAPDLSQFERLWFRATQLGCRAHGRSYLR